MSLSFLGALAIKQNVIRLEFSTAIYLSFINDFYDASIVGDNYWTIQETSSQVGIDGFTNHKVKIVQIDYAPYDELGDDHKRFLDLYTDRTLAAFPCTYTLTHNNDHPICNLDRTHGTETVTIPSIVLYGLKAAIEPTKIDQGIGGKDIAFLHRSLDPKSTYEPSLALSSFDVFEGDYAIDSGLTNLKKRIIRRMITSPGTFAHMPTYGVGIPNYIKRLNRSDVISKLETDIKLQIEQEPDIVQSSVKIVNVKPELCRVDIRIKTSDGKNYSLSTPFSTT